MNVLNNRSAFYTPRIVSGIRPTGCVHLGHLAGALLEHIALHKRHPGESFFFIADLHSLSYVQSPRKEKPEDDDEQPDLIWLGTLEVASAYLALGLDLDIAHLYRQSDLLEGPYLACILASCTPAHLLTQVPTYRRAIDQRKSPSAGLLSYPVLMASDILCLRATTVPVGYDQRINVETARTISRRFNSRFRTNLFPEPEAHFTQSKTIRGTDGKKMNTRSGNQIGLADRFDVLQDRVSKIQTDCKAANEPKDPESCNVFHLYSLVAPHKKVDQMRAAYLDGSIGYGEAKRELTFALVEFLAPFQERYHRYRQDSDFISDVLREGAKVAREQAQRTLDEVRAIVRLDKTGLISHEVHPWD